MKTKIWLGLGDPAGGVIFRTEQTPTADSYRFAAVIGPFRTMRGARFMRDHGRSNPHCQCVRDAERIAAGFAWDLVLRKWVQTRASVAAVA